MSHTEARRATTGDDDRVVLTGAAHMPTLAMCDCGSVSECLVLLSVVDGRRVLLRGAYA